MTRNEALLAALNEIGDGRSSTVALADLAQLPERTARRGLAALTRQGLVWSPVRGEWRLTETGSVLAASISPAADVHPRESLGTALWREGLGELMRGRLRPARRSVRH